jgi:hypothetical protein
VHEPVLYGHDLDAALAFVGAFRETSVVVFDSRSWLITARRRH